MAWFSSENKIKCNNIWYKLPKKGDLPVIGVCLDGTGPNHLAGVKMPNFWSGSYRDAYAFLPTVTNTNNVSIITGVAPSVHGVVAHTILEYKKKEGRRSRLNHQSLQWGHIFLHLQCLLGIQLLCYTLHHYQR